MAFLVLVSDPPAERGSQSMEAAKIDSGSMPDQVDSSGESKATRRRSISPELRNMSAITTGRDLLPNIDGRSALARRYRDITEAIFEDQGGVQQCAESRRQLVRRFAAAACLAEQIEARLVNGEVIDLQQHALLCSTLVRLAQRIGIDRFARDVTPNLREYLEQQASVSDAVNDDADAEIA